MGADLECHLSADNLETKTVVDCVKAALSHGHCFEEDVALLVYGVDPAEPITKLSAFEAARFLAAPVDIEGQRLWIVRLEGKFADVPVRLAISCSFPYRVITLSVLEDMLWGYVSKAKIETRRLEAFFEVCREVAEIMQARFGTVGTEHLHNDEVAVEVAEKNGCDVVDSAFFSKESMQELCDWYDRVYRPVRSPITG
ncbi:MAG: hypothetical protein HWE25_10210 [Alphaproteobacteria bacterium]|nr:hypothetical protein [Alphaproteobacteria bacterium]